MLVGPTASGKSDVAMALAPGRGAEIVAVDSMQVYRGMDIGTAKPTDADQAAVAHHCLDLVDPSVDFTVTSYAAAARAALAGIAGRGRSALLVAGTGLYLRAVIDDLSVPPQFPEIRLALEEELTRIGPEALHGWLAEVDPIASTRMEPSNARRIVRALEVCRGSGRPFSSFGPGLDDYQPNDWLQVGLLWPRQQLRQRIAERVGRMIDNGLLDEVRAILSGPLGRTARQALGYREIIEHLTGRLSLDEAAALIILRTQQYAVRQERWFRRDPRIHWISIESDPVAEVRSQLTEMETSLSA